MPGDAGERGAGLRGLRVLVPRGGAWGDRVAAEVSGRGGVPVVAPLVETAPPADPARLEEALDALARGDYAWLTVTSAATVDALTRRPPRRPVTDAGSTGQGHAFSAGARGRPRVAAVGEATARALGDAGIRVDLVPGEQSARGMLAEWPERARPGDRVLVLGSELARPALAEGLAALGYAVDVVGAYRTVGVALEPAVVEQLASGRVDAVLLTSGSVARSLAGRLADPAVELHPSVALAAIGPQTAADAEAVGLRVSVVAARHDAAGLLDALAEAAAGDRPLPSRRSP